MLNGTPLIQRIQVVSEKQIQLQKMEQLPIVHISEDSSPAKLSLLVIIFSPFCHEEKKEYVQTHYSKSPTHLLSNQNESLQHLHLSTYSVSNQHFIPIFQTITIQSRQFYAFIPQFPFPNNYRCYIDSMQQYSVRIITYSQKLFVPGFTSTHNSELASSWISLSSAPTIRQFFRQYCQSKEVLRHSFFCQFSERGFENAFIFF